MAAGRGFEGVRREIERMIGRKFSDGNDLQLLTRGPETFDVIFRALERAEKCICLEFYIIRDDETGIRLGHILKERAVSGIPVFLRYDHFGSLTTPASFWNELKDAGVSVMASRPFRWASPGNYSYRNHRKLIVVDGRVAFTGGLNIGDEYRGIISRKSPWRDTGIFIRGPSAHQLHNIFSESWARWGGEPVPVMEPVPAPVGESPVIPIFTNSARQRRKMRRLLHFSINAARRSIYLTTAYFTPSRRLLESLEGAVRRGVQVNLLLPGRSDFRAAFYAGRYFFSRLLSAGVRIFTYEGEILHAKTAVFDGTWSVIGSSNLDFRSLRKNDEGNVGVLGRNFGSDMIRIFSDDLSGSREIKAMDWDQRPLHEKLQERFFALFRRRL